MSGYVPRNLRGKSSGSNKPAAKKRRETSSADDGAVSTATKPRSRPASTTSRKKARPSPGPRPTGSDRRRATSKTRKRSSRRFSWRSIRLPRIRDWVQLGQRLGAASLGAAVLAVIMWFVAGQPAVLGPSPDEARGAAKTAAAAMFSYDYRTFADSRKNGAAHIVGDYHKEYSDLMDGLANEVEKGKARVTAEIADSAVMSDDVECTPKLNKGESQTTGETFSGGVRVLVFLDQITKNDKVKGTKVHSSRVVMCMVTTDDGWKAADATLI